MWTTTTWAWVTGRELGPASTTAHWQVEAAAELQEILVIQDIVEMTIQHHAVFQKTQMLCLMKNSGCFEFWSDQRQPKLIIRWNVCWSSCKDSHVCWARLKKCQNSVRVVGGRELQLSKARKQKWILKPVLHSCTKWNYVLCEQILNCFANPLLYIGKKMRQKITIFQISIQAYNFSPSPYYWP